MEGLMPLKGHFNTGHGIVTPEVNRENVPGAMLQEMTTQSAGILLAARFNPMEEFNTHDPFFNKYALGVLVRVKGARFRGFARPGDTLHTYAELTDQVGEIFEFKGRIRLNGKPIMTNSFQLANILSETLQGVRNPDDAPRRITGNLH